MAKISGLFVSKINRITLHAIFSLLGNTTLVYVVTLHLNNQVNLSVLARNYEK